MFGNFALYRLNDKVRVRWERAEKLAKEIRKSAVCYGMDCWILGKP